LHCGQEIKVRGVKVRGSEENGECGGERWRAEGQG